MRKEIALVAGALLFIIPGGQIGSISNASAQQNCQAFAQTGKQVCGTFLTYWNEHGALAQQGYPISAEMQEKSDTDGKTYTVQYFERAVFEAHPENKAPFDVLLSLLGNFYYKQKYPNGAPNQHASTAPGAMKFAETGHTVGGKFLTYWQQHGGLAQQGYPISDEFQEKSDLDGKTYTVQYFERAVFEAHPENKPPYDVLLSQLGTFRYKQKYASAQTVAVGEWGGKDIAMTVSASGTNFEFGCAHGSVDGTIPVASDGTFDATGTFVFEHGVQPAQSEGDSHPARYSGTTDGKTMTLTVTLADTGAKIGTFTLALGVQAHLIKCQ